MGWRLVALIAFGPLVAVQVAHTQSPAPQPSCAVACRVNPFTAPAGCNCSAPAGQTGTPTPAPVNQTPPPQQAPPVQQPPPAPGVPSCQVACQVNPFTAPPNCNCIAAGRGGGGGTPAPAPAPASPATAIIQDGSVTVRELLVFMDQLYRQRIAGVKNYYFLERMVVGPFVQASTGRTSGIVPVAFSQAAPPQAPLTGVDTSINRLRSFNKATHNGNPMMKEETPTEQAQSATKGNPDPLNRLSPADQRVARAAQADPTLLLGGFAEVADLLGKGAGDPLRAMQQKLREQIKIEQQTDEVSEDVLNELENLMRALEEEETSYALRGVRPPATAQGKYDLFVGVHYRGTLVFDRLVACAEPNRCSVPELSQGILIADKSFSALKPGVPFDPHANAIVCIVWRPRANVLAQHFAQSNTFANHVFLSAELWLPLAPEMVDFVLLSISSQVNGPGNKYTIGSRGLFLAEIDRPVRMTAVFGSPSGFGFEVQRFDRVYDDFRPVQTGAGPALQEPHRVREQLGQGTCTGQSLDPAVVGLAVLQASMGPQGNTGNPGAGQTPAQRCAMSLVGAVDRLRKDFVANQDLPPPEETARRLTEPW